MARSQNGWIASPSTADVNLTPLIINGVGFLPGVRGGDVHTVLEYVAQQVNDRVEKAINPGCWGYFYRANRNDPNSLSNHSSATAIDYNAPKHPNGVATSRTWTPNQIAEIHKILDEVGGVVRWGGDYTRTADAMHFEINASAEAVAAVAQKIRNGTLTEQKDWFDMAEKADLDKAVADGIRKANIDDVVATAVRRAIPDIAAAVLTSPLANRNVSGKETQTTLHAMVTHVEAQQDAATQVLARLEATLKAAVEQGK